MTATTGRGITYPTTSDTITPLASRFATLATTTDTAIGNATTPVASYRGTDAARLALGAGTIPVLAEGVHWYSIDTDRRWFYDGSAWLSADPGMYVVQPTSVVNGSLGASGRVDFTAQATVSLNGVFTTRFSAFRILINTRHSASNSPQFRMRQTGTDIITNYDQQRTYNSAATTLATVQSTAQTIFTLPGLAGIRHRITLDVFDPADVRVTGITGGGMSTGGAVTPVTWTFAGEHNIGSSYDGFTLFAGAGTFDGSVTVYGLS